MANISLLPNSTNLLENASQCSIPNLPYGTALNVLTIVGTIVGIFNFIGNMIIIVVCAKYRQLHTPCYVLLANVALGDGLYAIAGFPLYTVFGYYPQLFCFYFAYRTRAFMMSLVLFLSINNIAIVALDRFVALHFPYFYTTHITLGRALFAIVLNWAFCSVRALIWASLTLKSNGRRIYSLVEVAIGSVLFIWTTVVYCQLYATSRRYLAKDRKYGIKKQESKAQAAVLMAVVAAIAWTPVIVMRLIDEFVVKVGLLKKITFLLPYVASSLNLVIYTYRLSHYRNCVRRLFNISNTVDHYSGTTEDQI